jgi:hypothetical protein
LVGWIGIYYLFNRETTGVERYDPTNNQWIDRAPALHSTHLTPPVLVPYYGFLLFHRNDVISFYNVAANTCTRVWWSPPSSADRTFDYAMLVGHTIHLFGHDRRYASTTIEMATPIESTPPTTSHHQSCQWIHTFMDYNDIIQSPPFPPPDDSREVYVDLRTSITPAEVRRANAAAAKLWTPTASTPYPPSTSLSPASPTASKSKSSSRSPITGKCEWTLVRIFDTIRMRAGVVTY